MALYICGPHGYKEEFLSFSHYKSMGYTIYIQAEGLMITEKTF